MSSTTDIHLSSEIRILDPQIRSHVDTLRVILLNACARTVFPELLDIFGPDAVIKFMDIFGGLTIKVPDRSFLIQAIRDVDVYTMMSKALDDSATIAYLSKKYDIPGEYVREIHNRVKLVREKYGLEK